MPGRRAAWCPLRARSLSSADCDRAQRQIRSEPRYRPRMPIGQRRVQRAALGVRRGTGATRYKGGGCCIQICQLEESCSLGCSHSYVCMCAGDTTGCVSADCVPTAQSAVSALSQRCGTSLKEARGSIHSATGGAFITGNPDVRRPAALKSPPSAENTRTPPQPGALASQAA